MSDADSQKSVEDIKKSAAEFARKAHFDLWIHQNQLYWGRFSTLAILQAGSLAAMYSVKGSKPLLWCVLMGTMVLMIWLYRTAFIDRKLRNIHATELAQNFDFDPVPASSALGIFGGLRGYREIIEILYDSPIFLALMAADLIVFYHLYCSF
jgi:hypothetical protein